MEKPGDRTPGCPMDNPKESGVHSYALSRGKTQMDPVKPEVLQGTLDLMVLKALDALGPLHGYGIARRIEQVSGNVLALNEGTVYTAVVRLEGRGWISSRWGISENNRRARYYSITRAGRRQLRREEESWKQFSGVVGRFLELEGEK